MKKLKILGSGVFDLNSGREFYERQAEGIGSYFLESATAEIESLKLHGGIHPIYFGFHRMLIRRFPFAVYYKIESDIVIIFRILDCRKDPNTTKANLT